MGDTSISNLIGTYLNKEDIGRLKQTKTCDFDLLMHFLNNSSQFYAIHNTISLKHTLNLTKKMGLRHTLDDAIEHYLAVSTYHLERKQRYDKLDNLQFFIGQNHDYVEDWTQFIIEEERKNIIDAMKKRGKESNLGPISENETMGARQKAMKEFEKAHRNIEEAQGMRYSRSDFLDVGILSVDDLSRYKAEDNNYASYYVRLYNNNNLLVPLIKNRDRTHNEQTLWPILEWLEDQLLLTSLAEKEQYLRKLYAEDKEKYRKEKKIFIKEYETMKKEYEEEFKDADKKMNLRPEWRQKNIVKDTLHLYIGKDLLKRNKHHNLYKLFSQAHKNLLRETTAQASREYMFQIVYGDLWMDSVNRIEQGFVDYMHEGLEKIDVPSYLEPSLESSSEPDNYFSHTISQSLQELMISKQRKRLLRDSSEKILEKEELFARSLVYTSTLQQNFEGVNLLKAQTPTELYQMRNPKFYESLETRNIKTSYQPENFEVLWNRLEEWHNQPAKWSII